MSESVFRNASFLAELQNAGYFQSKTGTKRKPAVLVDSPDFNKALVKGVQPEALRAINLKNAARINNLHRNVADKFHDWRYKLRLGFSLLFYGYGSKKVILDSFGLQACKDGGVLSVNGWGHMLSLRSLLLKVVSMLRTSGIQSTRASGDAQAILTSIREGIGDQRLYLILHSIDAPALRSAEVHNVLGELAAISGIHIVASVDHVNAPILWDKRTATNFNWVYHDLTTFVPYAQETAGSHTLLCSATEEGERQGAAVVLQTLVPNARQIFRLLAEAQLEASDGTGLTFHELFKTCRERFLVTNELALRSHLNEFRDHHLIQTKRSAEGAETLLVPIAEESLEQILINLE